MKIKDFIRHWTRVRRGLIVVIDKFNEEELDFHAVPGGYSVRELILHIAQEEYGEVQYGMTGKIDSFPSPYNPEDYPTVAALKELLSSVHAGTLEYLAGLSDIDLESQIEAGWGGQYLLGEMLWHVLEHEIHHRGELSLILGLLGQEGLDA